MIFLDSAATSFQKPLTVKAAMESAFTTMSTPGRGGYAPSRRAAETALECRIAVGSLFGVDDPERVVFTMNATHALNLAIKSLVPRGGSVVISGYEHNAVTRPLHTLNAKITVAESPLFSPKKALAAFDAAIAPGTDAVICSHVSNAFGYIQPIEAIAALCRERKVPLIVDAAQSAGVLPLNLTTLGAACIAMPGHKGLYGPQGTGVLICGEETALQPLMEGGTGSLSVQQEMPDFLPDRLEAGTQNMPGIAGLLAGTRFVRELGPASILCHERRLTALLADGLRTLPGTEVFSQPDLFAQSGVLSFRVKGRDPEELGDALGAHGIAVRSGLHCAPLAHRSAGTLETGTVRMSVSVFNTEEEICRAVDVLGGILAGKY